MDEHGDLQAQQQDLETQLSKLEQEKKAQEAKISELEQHAQIQEKITTKSDRT